MNDHLDHTSPGEDDDPVLSAAGAELRDRSKAISPAAVEASVLRRRARRLRVVTGASMALVVLFGGLLLVRRDPKRGVDRAGGGASGGVEQLIASLGPRPVDPTKVRLVSSVSTFTSCDALIGDLRRVGAEHVGSQGFGANYGGFRPVGSELKSYSAVSSDAASAQPAANPGGATLGTNVQVAGVDELDFVKAAGHLIYDLDGKGNLRITDADGLHVLSTLAVVPKGSTPSGGGIGPIEPYPQTQVNQLLVDNGRVVIFGTEVEVSKPVAGDPSATQASTSYLTVTFVDATDPTKPTITDRVRVEGSLVSARLVGGEIRLVTTSNMADLGFVTPTTPNSVPKALEQNRRSVASSSAADWIPDWQRKGEAPTPLVPCERVHVPDTFSGVAMTSMVTFPLGTGRFAPSGTSILAPATTLYAGLDKVAISSEVWVDPIDQRRLKFENWQTAVHEFSFTEGSAPTYAGSGIVDGSTIGQFAFGEIGRSLAVVTTKGTPWQQDPKVGVDLTILTPDGRGGLARTAKVPDLSNGKGAVTAVRFVDGRVLISAGASGRDVDVIDVTRPAEPRRAGTLTLTGSVGYFHPLAARQALVVGSRTDTVGEGSQKQLRSWVQVQLIDVANADAPRVVTSWETPWASDDVGSDHHSFTYWPDRHLAMWGLHNTQWDSQNPGPNHAIVLNTAGTVEQVAMPVANKPNEVPSPCPTYQVTDPDAQNMIGPNGVALRCADKGTKEVEWPRYRCGRVDAGTVARFVSGADADAAFFVCTPAPQPVVSRVLVVSGTPMLLTDQTLEALDPTTFQSAVIAYHPTFGGY